MGDQGQELVYGKEDFDKVVARCNGNTSVFVSNAYYPDAKRGDSVFGTDTVGLDAIYFDFDAWPKVENALIDVKKFKDWCKENEVPLTIVFSGKKGFQVLVHLKPAIYSLTEKVEVEPGEFLSIKDYYREVQADLKKRLGLKTLDLRCAEPRRIRRVWNTRHFSKGVKSDTFCLPLNESQLDWQVGEIKQWAKNPRLIDTIIPEGNRTFEEFVDDFSIDPLATSPLNDPDGTLFTDFRTFEGEDKYDWFKKHLPWPCLSQEMYDPNDNNPTHMARFASAVWWRIQADIAPILEIDGQLVKITYSAEWLENFYLAMQYADVENTELRKAQINSIWNRRDPYKLPSCKVLYSAGLCVGKSCDRFSTYLGKYFKDVEM